MYKVKYNEEYEKEMIVFDIKYDDYDKEEIKDCRIEFSKDVIKLRGYLIEDGIEMNDLCELNYLWKEYSELYFCAGFLMVGLYSKEFIDYLYIKDNENDDKLKLKEKVNDQVR